MTTPTPTPLVAARAKRNHFSSMLQRLRAQAGTDPMVAKALRDDILELEAIVSRWATEVQMLERYQEDCHQ
jgi:hypothetical protein